MPERQRETSRQGRVVVLESARGDPSAPAARRRLAGYPRRDPLIPGIAITDTTGGASGLGLRVRNRKSEPYDISEVATGQQSPSGIASDGGDFYWAAANGIFKGGIHDPVEQIVSLSSAAWDVAVDDDYVYWTGIGSVSRAEKMVGATAQNLSRNVGHNGRGIALSDGFVYWCAESAVWKMPVSGGNAVQIATSLDNPWEIAVDDTFVYWTENAPGGAVRKIVK